MDLEMQTAPMPTCGLKLSRIEPPFKSPEIQTTRALRTTLRRIYYPKSPDWKRQTNKQRKQIDRARGSVLVPKNMQSKKPFLQKIQEVARAFPIKLLLRRLKRIHRRRLALVDYFHEWKEEHGGVLEDRDFPNRADAVYLRAVWGAVIQEFGKRNIIVLPSFSSMATVGSEHQQIERFEKAVDVLG